MRGTILTASLFAALALLSGTARTPAHAPTPLTIQFGTALGPAIGVFAYAPEQQGDWHASYQRWKPVTLYDVNGRYYLSGVRGARRVLVYKYNDEYFLPPQDRAWTGFDPRYDYRRRPAQRDYDRARPYQPAPARIDPRLGREIGILGYSPERAGEWRQNYPHWTPVTIYESNGRYFRHDAPGARRVTMYRYQDEYFLPPEDRQWVGADRRFDYDHRPNADDYRQARKHP